MTATINSSGLSVVSSQGVEPGSLWNSAKGMVRLLFGPSTSTLAPSAAIATFMSDGLVAMQLSPLVAPLSVCPRIA